MIKNTQRNILTGKPGFNIVVDHLHGIFSKARNTIFFSSLLQMDVSLYLLTIFAMTHYVHTSSRYNSVLKI